MELESLRPLLPALGLIVLGITGAAGWLWYQSKLDDERSEACRTVAVGKGWSFAAKDPDVPKELGLPRGWGSRWQRNFARGTAEGLPFVLFDDITSNKNSGKIVRTAAAFKPPEVVPEFHLLRKGPLAFLLRSLGWPSVAFDADPMFGETFVLEAREPDAVREHFSAGLRNHLVQQSFLTMRGENGWLFIYEGNTPVAPELLPSFLQQCARTARLFSGR